MNSFAITQIIALVSLFLGVFGIICMSVCGWANPWRSVFKAMGIMGIIVAVVSGATLLVRSLPPIPTCIATAGSKVQWVHRYDSSRYVFVDLGNRMYCRVYDARLYYMGVGYTLDQDYEGYPEGRP